MNPFFTIAERSIKDENGSTSGGVILQNSNNLGPGRVGSLPSARAIAVDNNTVILQSTSASGVHSSIPSTVIVQAPPSSSGLSSVSSTPMAVMSQQLNSSITISNTQQQPQPTFISTTGGLSLNPTTTIHLVSSAGSSITTGGAPMTSNIFLIQTQPAIDVTSKSADLHLPPPSKRVKLEGSTQSSVIVTSVPSSLSITPSTTPKVEAVVTPTLTSPAIQNLVVVSKLAESTSAGANHDINSNKSIVSGSITLTPVTQEPNPINSSQYTRVGPVDSNAKQIPSPTGEIEPSRGESAMETSNDTMTQDPPHQEPESSSTWLLEFIHSIRRRSFHSHQSESS